VKKGLWTSMLMSALNVTTALVPARFDATTDTVSRVAVGAIF